MAADFSYRGSNLRSSLRHSAINRPLFREPPEIQSHLQRIFPTAAAANTREFAAQNDTRDETRRNRKPSVTQGVRRFQLLPTDPPENFIQKPHAAIQMEIREIVFRERMHLPIDIIRAPFPIGGLKSRLPRRRSIKGGCSAKKKGEKGCR